MNLATYGNAALYFDPNGSAKPGTGPRLLKWLLGGSVSLLTDGSNLGSPAVQSSYARASSPARYSRPGFILAVVPAQIGAKVYLLPMNGNYTNGT
jgi:hypothetical protein